MMLNPAKDNGKIIREMTSIRLASEKVRVPIEVWKKMQVIA